MCLPKWNELDWRKLLQIRTIIREHIWHRTGNGNKVFVWFIKWCEECPLRSLKTVRQITSAGFDMNDKVVDVIEGGRGNGNQIGSKYMFLLLFQILKISCYGAIFMKILKSSRSVVSGIRLGQKCCVPLASRGALQRGSWKCQPNWIQIHVPPLILNLEDKLLWRNIHEHLKEFSVSRVWDTIRPEMLRSLGFTWGLAFMDNIPSRMQDIVAALIPISNKSLLKSVIARLVVADSSYYIWLKWMSLRYKNSANAARCLDHWQISKYNMSYDL
uniref:RNA-directed DNA polymerase, eukaryota, reverse transcriptase zinc-binding domain protein n=1 Tax=Tanacetum cinerariifolium TaxID=118510 RepID=A0A6L2LYT6_TANCI|nr:hypothetical protein [Tanacetum cinerariifolium]